MPYKVGDTFICPSCGQETVIDRTDAEMTAEAEQNFSPLERKEGIELVCDPCYDEFMEWLKAHPEMRLH